MTDRLVTVVISTYNSSNFIKEALDSVSSQTLKEIELIITDDHSSDNTVELCRQWIDGNKSRFVNIEMLTSYVNTGISANANRGLHAASGSWIKFLGADDYLKPNCLLDNLSFVESFPEVKVLFSRIEVYKDTFMPLNLIEITPDLPYDQNWIMAPWKNADMQYRMLLLGDRIHFTPSVFMHKETLISLGGFNENFKLLEDYPLWLKLTKNGHRLYFMEKVTVNYRKHSGAVNNFIADYLINPNYFRTEYFRRLHTYPNLPIDIRLEQRFKWYACQVFRLDVLNKNGKLNRFLWTLFNIYLNPFKHYIRMKKLIIRDLKNNEFYQ